MLDRIATILGLLVSIAISATTNAQDESSNSLPGARSSVYKTVGDTQLRLHVFSPPGTSDQARPAIVYFFGGGWIGGSVSQQASRCEYFCSRGMVAVAADYRVKSRHGVGAFECVADAKSAIRWLRAHAAELGIDEKRIVAAGGSSGGHLAASTALIDSFDEPNENLGISSVPNALVLQNPGLDLSSLFVAMDREKAVAQFGEWITWCELISPLSHVRAGAPPTIIFHGTADALVPFEHSQRFANAMRAQGNRCELVAYDARSHGFSLLETGDGSDFSDTLRRTDKFLISLDYLTGKPIADAFTYTKQVDRFFESDGVNIRYIDVGPRDGDPVVLLHGFSQRIESAWLETGIIDALDDEFRVIALDWRGHGKSDTPHDSSMYGNAVAGDVISLLDHLEIDKAHFVGYSMGGHITFRLLADHPDRTLSAIPCADGGTHYPDEFTKVSQRSVESQRSSNDVKALAAVMQSFRALDADPAKLAGNTVPCLAIIGEHDPFRAGLQDTANNMTNIEVEVIKGQDHITALHAPEFTAAMMRFIEKHSQGNSADDETPGDAQLYENMGPYHREFTTDSELAQKYLNQGMVWIQAFNHDEAKRSFLKAAELDPKCAWAWWGVAYCEGPNYNDPHPDDNRSRAAWYALQNALARIENASIVERDLIIALKSRYSNPWPKDRSKLDQAYADAMALVWEKYSNDADVGVLYAEAMMQLKPWELYAMDRKPVEGTMKIRSVLEIVMKLDTSHAGAKHLYIHAVEPSVRPDDALEAARELENMVSASGHFLHMPSHIYVQTGHWQQAIDQNVKAVDSDNRYRELSPNQVNQYGYQFHNSHMLVFAAMMVGQEKTAMKYAREMWSIIPKDEMKEQGPDIDFSLMCVYDVQKRFGRWDAILEETAPADYLVLTTAYYHAHRAIAYAAKKQFDDAENEYVEFLNARAKVPKDSIEDGTFYQRALKVADHFIQGEIALQKQDWLVAIWHLEKAAEVEDTLRYTEPPYWLQPVRHTLGAVYMKAGMFTEAEQTYRKDLSFWRDNGWSLLGLSEALEAQGKSDEALVEMARFQRVWEKADEQLLTTSCKCIENLNK